MTICAKGGELALGDVMSTNRQKYEISDEEWETVKDLLPPERTGKPAVKAVTAREAKTQNRLRKDSDTRKVGNPSGHGVKRMMSA